MSDELATFSSAIVPTLGSIVALQMDWRSFRARPGLDSEGSPPVPPLMRVTTNRMTVELMVIPPRTPSTLAVALIRLAGGTPIPPELRHSLLVERARHILERASADVEHRNATTVPPAPPGGSGDLPPRDLPTPVPSVAENTN
ncbi:MAG: transposase [Williamsia herbipolensis]|nr:transposase [Williamsia herbipolensis]